MKHIYTFENIQRMQSKIRYSAPQGHYPLRDVVLYPSFNFLSKLTEKLKTSGINMYQNINKAILIILFFLFFPIPIACADQIPIHQTLRVTPIIITADITAGKKQEYSITVENLLNSPIGIHSALSPLDAGDEENGIRFDFPQQKSSPIFSWMKLSENDFIIPARGKKIITLKISVPKSSQIQEANAIIFLTPFITKPLETGPSVTGKVGIIVLGNAGTVNPAEAIKFIQIPTFNFGIIARKLPLTPLLRVKNNYSKYIKAKPFITIIPFLGQPETFLLVDKDILPEHIRRWTDPLKLKQNKHIFYKAIASVSIGGGEKIQKTTYFILFPIKKFILIFILVASCIFIIKRRKGVKKAISILLFGK